MLSLLGITAIISLFAVIAFRSLSSHGWGSVACASLAALLLEAVIIVQPWKCSDCVPTERRMPAASFTEQQQGPPKPSATKLSRRTSYNQNLVSR